MNSLLDFLSQGFYSIFPFIILLGFLIFVHELGHFLVAKWCGVRVEVFSLGFGKKILQKKVGATTYCISLIPLGGYVKMFGDEIGAEISPSEKKFSFTHKNVWQRIAVVIAGPLMNFFFAIFIFTVISMAGEESRAPKAGDITVDSLAHQNGFRSGDVILNIDGKAVATWDEFQDYLNQFHDKNLPIEVNREGSAIREIIHSTSTLKPNNNPLSADNFISEIEGLSYNSKAAVLGIIQNSLADKNGLKIGDRITKVNDREIFYFRELEASILALQNQTIEITVERYNGKNSSLVKVPFQLGTISSLASLGIESSDLYLSKVLEKSPAAEAGLQVNDRILKVNSVVPAKWEDILDTVKSYDGNGSLKITVLRNLEEKVFEITPKLTSQVTQQGIEEKRFTIGISPWVINALPATVKISYSNPIKALSRGYKRTIDMTVITVVSFLRLIQNKISPKNIGGVLSIGQAASETFRMSFLHFLQLMAILSVNLFILNLLPIPVLDGGHLLFYSIEALRGAPLSMRKLEIAQQVGLVVLMSLMALSLFNDVTRIFGF